MERYRAISHKDKWFVFDAELLQVRPCEDYSDAKIRASMLNNGSVAKKSYNWTTIPAYTKKVASQTEENK